MKKIIVCTTINPPTEALEKFKAMDDWDLIVVGDKKTPHDLYKEYDYLSPEYQETNYKKLSDLIGWNCIQRRNIGFVEAYKRGADVVATVDDDNIPFEDWGKNLKVGTVVKDLTVYHSEDIVFDPISVTNHFNLWHRGFPIQLLHNRNLRTIKSKQSMKVDIQADFWNGDPDIDAICRMQFKPNCGFHPKHFPFTTTVLSPFNSQNTFISREALKHYFVFPHIGRMDDIWASYFVEAMGFNVVYEQPSVFQKRNKQNLTVNFEDEILGYTKTLEMLEAITIGIDRIVEFLPEKSWKAFKEYKNELDKYDRKSRNITKSNKI